MCFYNNQQLGREGEDAIKSGSEKYKCQYRRVFVVNKLTVGGIGIGEGKIWEIKSLSFSDFIVVSSIGLVNLKDKFVRTGGGG